MKNGYYEENVIKSWWVNGKLHREDGPAVIYPDGTQFWYKNDEWHREDGPAVIWSNGSQEWFVNGKQHREDGPAVIWSNGSQEWFVNDNDITDEVTQWFEEFNLVYETMEFEDKMALKFFIRGLAT